MRPPARRLRYYPLTVDTPDGVMPEMWANLTSTFTTDYGKHPIGKVADVDTVIAMATSHPAAPRSQQEEALVESEWRSNNVCSSWSRTEGLPSLEATRRL